MSQTTFFRKMKSVMEVSPNDYIRMARVERAASILLEIEDVRISDVAYELGFPALVISRVASYNIMACLPRIM